MTDHVGELWVASDVLYVCHGVDPERPETYLLIECEGQPRRRMWPSGEYRESLAHANVFRSALDENRTYPNKPHWWRRVA